MDFKSVLALETRVDRFRALRERVSNWTTSELHAFLPNLLLLMLGFDREKGIAVTEADHSAVGIVREILSPPNGVLLKKLMEIGDNLKYEFPVAKIATATRIRMQRSMAGMYGQGAGDSVMPNIFEYYFFLFALVVKDQGLNSSVWTEACPYRVLFTDYMNYFVPTTDNDAQLRTNDSATRSEEFLYIMSEFWFGEKESRRSVNLIPKAQVTEDQICGVLMLIKHLHTFTNRIQIERTTANNAPPLSSFMTELSQVVIQHKALASAQIYWLLKYLMSTNDAISFTTIIEAWLKYVRPWRYGKKRIQATFDREIWGPFVQENFLSYTNIFGMFISRALELDISFHPELNRADTGYRLLEKLKAALKVFANPEMIDLIREVEQDYLSPRSYQRGAPTLLRGLLLQLEDPDFLYIPLVYRDYPPALHARLRDGQSMLSSRVVSLYMKVGEQLQKIQEAEIACRPAGRRSSSDSFWSTVANFIFEEPRKEKNGVLMKDFKRILREIQNHLREIFPSDVVGVGLPHSPTRNSTQTTGNHMVNPDLKFDAALQRRSQFYKKSRNQPVRSFENAILVKWTYRLSSWINDKYEPKPWLFMSKHESDQWIREQMQTDGNTSGLFAIWHAVSKDIPYKISVLRHGSVFTDPIYKTVQGLTVDNRNYFGEIGELVHFYTGFPMHDETMLRYEPHLYNVDHESKLNHIVFPVNLRPLADYRTITWTAFILFLLLVLLSTFSFAFVITLLFLSTIGLFALVRISEERHGGTNHA